MALTDQVSLLLMLEARDKASTILSQVGNALQSLSQRSLAAGAGAAQGLEKLEAAQVRAEAESRAFQAAIKEQALAQEELKAVAEAAAIGSTEASLAEEAALKRVAAADTAVAERSTALAAAQKEAAGAFGLTSKQLDMVGIAAGTVAVGVGFIAEKSVKAAGDFQASMTKLVTSAGEAQNKIADVSSGILKLAVDSGTSTQQLADGMYIVESAGYHAKDGLTVLTAAAQGARAEQADLKSVTDAVTSAMRDYHMQVIETKQGLDGQITTTNNAALTTTKLVAAVGAGKSTFGEFTGALHSVLPVASAAKISLDDILGAMASMTVHGMSADQAAQNMADAIRHMQNPTQLQTKYLAQLGITAGDLSNDLSTKGLTGTIDEVVNAINAHMGPAGKVVVDAFNQSKSAVQGLQDMMGRMTPSVRTMAQAFLDGKVTLNQWHQEVKSLPVDQANLANEFATSANRAHGFNDMLKAGQPAALAFSAALNKAMGDATGLNVALMVGGDNAGYTANAIKQVAGAAVEAGGNVKGWSEIQSTFNYKMSVLKESVEAAKISIGSGLLPILTAVAGALAAVITPIAQWAAEHQTLAGSVVAVVGALAGLVAVGYTIAKTIEVVRTAMIALGVVVEGVNGELALNPIMLVIMAIALIAILLITHWSQVKAVLGAVWDWMKSAGSAVVNALVTAWNWLVSIVMVVVHAVVAAWNWLVTAVMAVVHALVAPLIAAWNMIASVTMTVWNAIAAFFRKWWPLLLMIFMPFIFAALALWNAFHTQVENFAIAVWNGIKGFLSSVWDEIKSVAETVWNLIQKYVILPNQILWAELKSLWDTLMSWLSSIWSSIASRASAAWNLVRAYVIAPLQAMYSAVVSIFNNVRSAIESAINSTLSWLRGVGSWFVSVGEAIIHGIVSGVESAAGALFGSLYSLAKSALSAARGAIKSGSPSRLFADEVGEPITQGIAQGVLAAHPVLISAMQSTAGAALSAAGRGFGVPGAGGGLALASAPSGTVSGGGGGMQVVIDLRGTQFFAPKQVDDLLDVLGKRFVQQILPAAGVQIRR